MLRNVSLWLIFCKLLECFQNKFYIESKLNRDLREDLMRLFAVHVAEKHIDRLMRECNAPLVAPGRMSLYV